jgi:hypothetical protein
MPDFAGALGANKAASALLVLFIPSKDRRNKSIDQRHWVKETRNVLGTFGLIIDDDYLEIGFPMEGAAPPKQPKGKKRR